MQCLSSAAHLGWHESRDIPNRAAGEPTLTAGGLLVAPILVANTMRWKHGPHLGTPCCLSVGRRQNGDNSAPMQRPRGVQRRPCCRSKHSCRRASRFTVVHKERQGGQRCALPASSAQGLLRLCCSSPPRTGYERGGKGPSVWHLHTTRCQDGQPGGRRRSAHPVLPRWVRSGPHSRTRLARARQKPKAWAEAAFTRDTAGLHPALSRRGRTVAKDCSTPLLPHTQTLATVHRRNSTVAKSSVMSTFVTGASPRGQFQLQLPSLWVWWLK